MTRTHLALSAEFIAAGSLIWKYENGVTAPDRKCGNLWREFPAGKPRLSGIRLKTVHLHHQNSRATREPLGAAFDRYAKHDGHPCPSRVGFDGQGCPSYV